MSASKSFLRHGHSHSVVGRSISSNRLWPIATRRFCKEIARALTPPTHLKKLDLSLFHPPQWPSFLLGPPAPTAAQPTLQGTIIPRGHGHCPCISLTVSRLSVGNAGACPCQQLQVSTVSCLFITAPQKGRGSGLDPFPEKGLLGAYANVPPLSRAPSL